MGELPSSEIHQPLSSQEEEEALRIAQERMTGKIPAKIDERLLPRVKEHLQEMPAQAPNQPVQPEPLRKPKQEALKSEIDPHLEAEARRAFLVIREDKQLLGWVAVLMRNNLKERVNITESDIYSLLGRYPTLEAFIAGTKQATNDLLAHVSKPVEYKQKLPVLEAILYGESQVPPPASAPAQTFTFDVRSRQRELEQDNQE